ncbi:hypothetical protein ACMD2_10378 [Ananas comosus]|uniref:Uncharacterized protein n=1 Tax=Ananas comosus TaxID=4615 RepID=A0A199UMW0_ANACO|nr:hypothetical protein ACMD2_10378 [Ananas comosus]
MARAKSTIQPVPEKWNPKVAALVPHLLGLPHEILIDSRQIDPCFSS